MKAPGAASAPAGGEGGARSSSLRASTVVGLFFIVPIVGSFLLSFTDFDIYALGRHRPTCG